MSRPVKRLRTENSLQSTTLENELIDQVVIDTTKKRTMVNKGGEPTPPKQHDLIDIQSIIHYQKWLNELFALLIRQSFPSGSDTKCSPSRLQMKLISNSQMSHTDKLQINNGMNIERVLNSIPNNVETDTLDKEDYIRDYLGGRGFRKVALNLSEKDRGQITRILTEILDFIEPNGKAPTELNTVQLFNKLFNLISTTMVFFVNLKD